MSQFRQKAERPHPGDQQIADEMFAKWDYNTQTENFLLNLLMASREDARRAHFKCGRLLEAMNKDAI